ncbi:M48 family metallopeptidase [Notoacmeibacter marinus]|uniref:M48 family metallopeptidase n=1 Tax=Notoacmeibacter marinus TaxID=1876515 RepID=UPI000DF309C3|nr:M48 family metallopeptidase [Notoacmeibacter marinus]
MGEQAFAKVVESDVVIIDSDEAETIRRIVTRLEGPAAELSSRQIDWDVVLLNDSTPNAFALPNGNIAVHTGILPATGLDAGLAAVIGHEMAHVIARHPEERMTQAELARVGQLTASIFVGSSPESQSLIYALLGLGSEFGVLRPFSRVHESEADRIGLILMARACFDPRAAPKVWERMARISKGLPEILSTHPGHGTRFAELTRLLPDAIGERDSAGCEPLPSSAGS